MPHLIINYDKITPDNFSNIIALCPFGAIHGDGQRLSIGEECRMCRMCVKKSNGAITFVEDEAPKIDKSLWSGIAVFAEICNSRPHPVVAELIGKARELANKVGQQVIAVAVGKNLSLAADELLSFGADRVFIYDAKEFEFFTADLYANAVEDFIKATSPCVMMFGATINGRSLAPRVAARFATGLTADCTSLEIKENTDLVQIRPAFGGNIMAQIVTPNRRPQLCTVRYKVFSAPPKTAPHGEIITRTLPPELLATPVKVLSATKKEAESDISDAEILVAVGRGIKSKNDLALAEEFAALIGGQLACTRPLVENGWFGAKKQIGLSGRTVAPKLLVTLGISGSVQFAAGIKASGYIVAVNTDRNAPIMDIADYAIVGDIYDVLPQFIAKLRSEAKNV